MRETVTISELDLALVNALQLRPRASWSELSPLLGVTAGTLVRRWERLPRGLPVAGIITCGEDGERKANEEVGIRCEALP